MLSHLATVLQELSGEEGADGDPQGVSSPPPHEASLSEAPEDAMDRLAHLEQLVVRLKEMIRDKDSDMVQKSAALADKDAQLKSEKEAAEARFTKLKLQAKAKMAALNKQISDLRGQEGARSPDTSLTQLPGVEDQLGLKARLSREEAASLELRERLQASELLLQDREAAHAEQVRLLQAVVSEKDMRFQEQIQKHEEEMLQVSGASIESSHLRQAVQLAQRRCEELEEALSSRSQDLEMLQQEVTSADQQKQILTTQFREIENKLAEEVQFRAKQDRELAALRETLHTSEAALVTEKMEVARVGVEMKAAELEHQDASMKHSSELARLDKELAALREAAEHASCLHLETAQSEVEELSRELAILREVKVEAQNQSKLVEEMWRRLRSLSEMEPSELPCNLSDVLDLMTCVEATVSQLKEQLCEREEVVTLHSHTVAALQELDQVIDEKEEALVQIQQLEHQIQMITEQPTERSLLQDKAPEELVKVQETDPEREPFHCAVEQTYDHSPSQLDGTSAREMSTCLPEVTEDSPGEESTLIAEETSALSIPAEPESSPELVGLQSSEESKATSSDEMVASTDSEVAHSSWTILEAVHQDGSHEWPSIVQDFGALQTWEETSVDPETSSVEVQSSSVIRQSIQLTQVGKSGAIEPAGQDEELHKRYEELLVELHGLREAAAASQEKIQSLLEETERLSSEKVEVGTQAEKYAEELQLLSQHSRSLVEKHGVEVQLLEEQLEILSCEKEAKEQQLQALQTELAAAHQSLAEQESQARLLSVQLEDREMLSSELEKKLEDFEANILGLAQTSKLNNQTLSVKEAQICELQQCLSQREQEILELNFSSSAQLLHVEEEKLVSEREVQRLKEQMVALEMQKVSAEDTQVDGEVVSLRKLKEELEGQLTTTKKKLQVLLLQRKELLKKVADYEEAAKVRKEKDPAAKSNASPGDQSPVVQETDARQLQLALKSREEHVEKMEETLRSREEKMEGTLRLREKKMEETLGSREKKMEDTLRSREEKIEEALRSREEEMEDNLKSREEEMEETLRSREEIKEALKSREEHVEMIEKALKSREEHVEKMGETLKSREEHVEKMELNLRSREDKMEQTVKLREEEMRHRVDEQVKTISETLELNRKLSEDDKEPSEIASLQSQVASLQAECEGLQKRVAEAQESRKETIRKAKEKDRHHREQLKQQKEEHSQLMERFQVQTDECQLLQTKLKQSEEKREKPPQLQSRLLEKSAENVQEVWVDFEGSEGSPQPQTTEITGTEESLMTWKEERKALQMTNATLEDGPQETQSNLSLKESQLLELGEELEALKEKERQMESLSMEVEDLREQCSLAQAQTKALKAEMKAASEAAASASATTIATLQAEVDGIKQFMDNKNQEILELSQQLAEQNSLIHSMHGAVSHKDELIATLKGQLGAEQDRSQRLEVPLKQEENESEQKLKQLHRKLQAALVSRKEAMKENKSHKDQLALNQSVVVELGTKLQSAEEELEKLKAEKMRLIEEVDRMLLENQSLGSSCESLKLAMEGILNEKEACSREAEFAKEDSARMSKEWEEKVQNMKEEYETLLKSYENVSDEAERVRRVLEAARQERHELAARARTIESARQEAEEKVEEAQKEVETVKDKMRKFVKTKQQKIMELEEENERLREMKEVVKPDPVEVQRLAEELQALKAELQDSVGERSCLQQQVERLREQQVEKGHVQQAPPGGPSDGQEEVVAPQNSEVLPIPHQQTAALLETPAEVVALAGEEQSADLAEAAQQVSDDGLMQGAAEWAAREANHQKELVEYKVQARDREACLAQDFAEKEGMLKELLRNTEMEKDNLEERLMNQLAHVNGSIAGYQQEAVDLREQLARMEREAEALEDQARREQGRAAGLEEVVRHAERLRAEAESGRQRELEQQLRSAHRVREGSQSRARQLEQLLREKQVEVRQLQRDCIQYQERISQLGRETKALQLGQEETGHQLELAQLEASKVLETLSTTEVELDSCRVDLGETRARLSEAALEQRSLEQSLQQKEAHLRAEAELTLDSVRFRLGAELKEMELRLEEASAEKEKEEDAKLEAREAAAAAESRAQEMQARLDESLARLAAFSRCMSSLQDDRDRVLDEIRQWETRFNNALQGKDAEVREYEGRARDLSERLQRESELKEELRSVVSRLQKEEQGWQLRLDEAEGTNKISQAVLEEERTRLQRTSADLASSKDQVQRLKSELESVAQRAKALDEAVGRLQSQVEQSRTKLKDRGAEERRLCLTVEQLETDLRSSKSLTESLQTQLNQKEQREVDLLVEKEHAVAQAAEEAQKEAHSRAQRVEEELEQRRRDQQGLEEKMRTALEESKSNKASLDSITSAMGSLQDDRDRVLGLYKMLEEKHLQVLVEKDALIQEAARENNSLKEELRALLVQRDDLHAEKGKLSAQLHGYREELNQVLSMKDSQHRQLQAAHREKIAALEKERDQLESHVRSRVQAKEARTGRLEREILSRTEAPGAEVEKLHEQLQASREQAAALEASLLEERDTQESRRRELSELRWEGGVMRTESETAQERVAELARDLLAVEQKLLEEKQLTSRLTAENRSFALAMASLQDSRDRAEDASRQLTRRLEEASRGAGGFGGAGGEVWGLKNALQALQNDRERLLEQLQMQSLQLQGQRSELERLGAGELIQVSQELMQERSLKEELLRSVTRLEAAVLTSQRDMETLRLERLDWMAQAEQLKQQTLATLTERDQQLRLLSATLEEARARKPMQEVGDEIDSAPGAPQEKGSLPEGYSTELRELQQRLEEELQQRLATEEQLMVAQERLKRHSQAQWLSAEEPSEVAVHVEPQEGGVTRTRRGGRGMTRMVRGALCSRQRTPLLLGLYLLTVHMLLLLCMGGYL